MIPLGLDSADQVLYERTLRTSHTIRVRISVLDSEEKVLSTLIGPRSILISGQVNVDATADVGRSLNLTLLDADRKLRFDSTSPADGALFADRMIQVEYGVWVPDLTRWVDVPIFTGPVTQFARDEVQVTIEGQGKESLALPPSVMWKPMTIKRGVDRTEAILRIMRAVGEQSFSIPSSNAGLPKDVSLGRDSSGWNACKMIARGMDRQLFYDGAGVLRLRPFPGNPVYTFSEGDEGDVKSVPQFSYDMAEVRNTVQVKGGKPKGAKQAITFTAVAPASEPLSPAALARNGEPRYLVEFIEDDSIRSNQEAKEIGERTLADRLRQAVDVGFESLPIPHLEPGDLVRVQGDGFGSNFRLNQFAIPLNADGGMTVGYLDRVRVNRKAIR